ncbi:Uncharacterised protein [Shigella sonnei]|nr:Uncharacterised protein [Shigella sonnei]
MYQTERLPGGDSLQLRGVPAGDHSPATGGNQLVELRHITVAHHRALISQKQDVAKVRSFPGLNGLAGFTQETGERSCLHPGLTHLMHSPVRGSQADDLRAHGFRQGVQGTHHRPELRSCLHPGVALNGHKAVGVFQHCPRGLPLAGRQTGQYRRRRQRHQGLNGILTLGNMADDALFHLIRHTRNKHPVSHPGNRIQLNQLPAVHLPGDFCPDISQRLARFYRF